MAIVGATRQNQASHLKPSDLLKRKAAEAAGTRGFATKLSISSTVHGPRSQQAESKIEARRLTLAMVVIGFEDRQNARIARVFFEAATKHSNDSEDILPQEAGRNADLSVFHVFSILFPELVDAGKSEGSSPC
jgi:hypothetical protein